MVQSDIGFRMRTVENFQDALPRGAANSWKMDMPQHSSVPESEARSDQEIREPKHYRVILCNDDYTTMDFVIEILIVVFHKPAAEATRIMLDVHKKGKGLCGIYTYDIATTKIDQVHQLARKREFPLRCALEEA